MRLTWKSESGKVFVISDDGTGDAWLLKGLKGVTMPPVEVRTQNRGLVDGSVLVGTRWKERTISLTVYIPSDKVLEALSSFAWPRGELRLANRRQARIGALYAGGLEGGKWTSGGLRALIVFRCPWPFFQSDVEMYYRFTAGSGIPKVYPIGLPLRVRAGAELAEEVLVNGGEVTAWPKWRLCGPAGRFELYNLTLGKRLIVDFPLQAEDCLTVTTRPGEASAVRDSGQVMLSRARGEFWGLAPGENVIRIVATGASVNTQAEMWYRHEYVVV